MQANRRWWVAAAMTLALAATVLAAGAMVMDGSSEEDALDPTPQPSVSNAAQPTAGSETNDKHTPSDEHAPTPTATGTGEPVETTPTAPTSAWEIGLALVIDGLHGPSGVFAAPDGSDRLFVTERPGRIRIVEDGEFLEHLFLDITDQVNATEVEQGLLGLAFHPRYLSNGQFYVYYTDLEGDTVVSRFTVTEDPLIADRGSEQPILQIDQPHYSHNGGQLAFGPDNYLYIALGDGENPGDPHRNAQNPSTLLGSILRIDVDNGDPYAIPPDNPFVNDPERRGEIWAYGLRNPWGISFDAVTDDLYIADAGQWEVEEINLHPAGHPGGRNYGWPIMEGDQCFEAEECDAEGLTHPIMTYTRDAGGCAVVGGYVYRGRALPQLVGTYIFSDYCSGTVWGLTRNEGEWQFKTLLEADIMASAVNHDHAGEPYVVDIGGGNIYKLVPR